MSKARQVADQQRAEAKQLLNNILGLSPENSSNAVDRVVDCIISAAMLEVVLLQAEALNATPKEHTT